MEAANKCIIIAGAERSGKSFFAEKWAAKNGRPVFLYNAGEDGFLAYKELDFLAPDEQANHLGVFGKERTRFMYAAGPCDFFRIENQVFAAADFTKALHKYKFVKHFGTIGGNREDSALFTFLYRHGRGVTCVFDDTRAVFRNGLKSEHITLLSRKAHAGKYIAPGFMPKKRGIDIVLIYHNVDRVNAETWDYCSHYVGYKSRQAPLDNIENKDAYNEILKAYEVLKTAPKYECCIINLKAENIKLTRLSGAQIAKL